LQCVQELWKILDGGDVLQLLISRSGFYKLDKQFCPTALFAAPHLSVNSLNWNTCWDPTLE
jgi:hypothetical protein